MVPESVPFYAGLGTVRLYGFLVGMILSALSISLISLYGLADTFALALVAHAGGH